MRYLQLLFLCLLVWLPQSGCSLIGLTVGAVADDHAGRADLVRVQRVAPGTHVPAWKRDGGSVSESYLALDTLSKPTESTLKAPIRIKLRTRDREVALAADSVQWVQVPMARYKVTGVSMGLGFDILLFAVLFLIEPHPRAF